LDIGVQNDHVIINCWGTFFPILSKLDFLFCLSYSNLWTSRKLRSLLRYAI